MNLQDQIDRTIKAARAVQFAASDQLNLGQLIDALDAIPLRDEPQRVAFDFEYASPTTFDSWRGVYAELALGFDFNTVKRLPDMIAEAKAAVGKTFEGYKGGDFTMTRDTPVWVANYGKAGSTAIVGVYDDGWQIVLLTGYRPN